MDVGSLCLQYLCVTIPPSAREDYSFTTHACGIFNVHTNAGTILTSDDVISVDVIAYDVPSGDDFMVNASLVLVVQKATGSLMMGI